MGGGGGLNPPFKKGKNWGDLSIEKTILKIIWGNLVPGKKVYKSKKFE